MNLDKSPKIIAGLVDGFITNITSHLKKMPTVLAADSKFLGNKNIINKRFSFNDVSILSVALNVPNLEIQFQPNHKMEDDFLEIEMDDNIFEYFLVDESENTLAVTTSIKDALFPSLCKLKYFTSSVSKINIDGIVTFSSDSVLLNPNGPLEINCRGVINGGVLTESSILDLNLEGSGEFHVHGKCSVCNLLLKGTAKVNGYELYAESISLDMDGFVKAFLRASNSIRGKTSGFSKIEYKGHPVDVAVENDHGTISPA